MVSKFKSLIIAAGCNLWAGFSSRTGRLRRKSFRTKLREIPQWVRDFTHDFLLGEMKKGLIPKMGGELVGYSSVSPQKAIGDSFEKATEFALRKANFVPNRHLDWIRTRILTPSDKNMMQNQYAPMPYFRTDLFRDRLLSGGIGVITA